MFGQKAEYDELVNELYLYLMEDEADKLKSFQFRCSVFQWLKTTTIRFFIRMRDQGKVIDDESHEPFFEENNHTTSVTFEAVYAAVALSILFFDAMDDLVRDYKYHCKDHDPTYLHDFSNEYVSPYVIYHSSSSDYNYGLMDRDGNVITPPLYDRITAVSASLYLCEGDEGSVLLDD